MRCRSGRQQHSQSSDKHLDVARTLYMDGILNIYNIINACYGRH